MVDRLHKMSVFFATVILLSACAPLTPTISEKERQELENASPYSNDFGYMQALTELRKMILAKPTLPSGIIIQPKPITNTSVSIQGRGEDIPINVSNMVITALSKLSSPKIKIVPYDPSFVLTATQITNKVASSHLQPNLILAGSITEFDKDIEVKVSDMSLDAILDNGSSNAETGGEAKNSKRMSKVTIDLYLLSATTQEVLPGTSISNTISVVEIAKGRGFAFEIFGSGLEIEGRIKSSQGFHRAVRDLIGYSIVQLIGRAFELNYEPLLGIATKDPMLMKSPYTPPPPQKPSPVSSQGQEDREENNSSRVKTALKPVMEKQETKANQRVDSVSQPPAMNVQIALVHQQGSQQFEAVLAAGGELKSGSQYRIIVKPEQDCHLYIFQKDSTNKLYTIFPTSNLQQNLNNSLENGVTYFFPGKDYSFFLDEQKGSEQIYFYSTAKPDRHLDKILRQYNHAEDPARKEAAGQMIMAYLATKESVNTASPGQVLYPDKDVAISGKMSRVQLLSGNSMYVLPFMHR